MEDNKKNRQAIKNIVTRGLRETIKAHGPITKKLIGSAAKRIVNTIIKRK